MGSFNKLFPQILTMKKLFSILTLVFMATGCDYSVILPESPPQIVVEGWIEEGGSPVVMVTTTVPVTESVSDISDLDKYVVNWAKVTIYENNQEIVLTGLKNNDYFPPYIYTSSFIKGKAGNTYKLKVEYSGRTLTASTTIPPHKNLEYIKVRKANDNDESFYLTGGLKDNPSTKDYYKVFTKVRNKDKIYVSSFLGLTDDEILDEGINEIPINNGSGIMDNRTNSYFTAEDFISVRFCTLDKEAWAYWNDFEEIQSLTTNPIFQVSTDIRSNIKGGLGYWAGYGSVYYKVSIPDSLKLGRIY